MKVAMTPAQKTDSKNARRRRMDLDFVIVFVGCSPFIEFLIPFDPEALGVNRSCAFRAACFDLLAQFEGNRPHSRNRVASLS